MRDSDSILKEASKVVRGARRHHYGTPSVNHGRTAALWSVYLGREITPEQVCMLNILQKVSRGMNRLTRDTLVDIAGYAENVHLIQTAKE